MSERGHINVGEDLLKAARAADRKLIYIPVLFIICRMWGNIRFLMFWANIMPPAPPPLGHKILLTLQVSLYCPTQ